MPTPRKLSIYFAFPSYGGNGGIASEHPNVRQWFTHTVLACKQDERIGNIYEKTLSDTPITMVRNRFVELAKAAGADVLVMVDSDQNPMLYQENPEVKPFFPEAFNFLYRHWEKGPVVIGAPYCGPPPHENVYVFQFGNKMDLGEDSPLSLDQYTREEAAKMAGIQPCAALPTGLIMYDMRAFDLMEPPYFWYEWTDNTQSKKASTEDVTNTRSLAMNGSLLLGYNPVHCYWNAWIGHHKPWCVGKPRRIAVEEVAESFRKAVELNRTREVKQIEFSVGDDLLQRIESQQDRLRARSKAPAPEPPAPQPEYGRRVIFGREVKTYWHFTPDDHLLALHRLVLQEKERLAKQRPDKPVYLRAVEIGSWVGESAVALLDAIGSEGHLWCVDPWEGNQDDWTRELAMGVNLRRLFEQNIAPFGGHVSALKAFSPEAAEHFDNDAFDFIFIDGGHSYEQVKADIEAWLPKLRPNGLMCGHDYATREFPGVTKAVDERFGRQAWIEGRCEMGSIWCWRMPVSAKRFAELLCDELQGRQDAKTENGKRLDPVAANENGDE